MDFGYKDLSQISEKVEVKAHVYPKYGKSTTDPTYYEPSATRIANMKKASGVKLEGIYDFYIKDDVEKFNAENFANNIHNANVDIRFNNKLNREEISQITNDLGFDTQDIVNKKSEQAKEKADRINDTVQASKIIESQNSKSSE